MPSIPALLVLLTLPGAATAQNWQERDLKARRLFDAGQVETALSTAEYAAKQADAGSARDRRQAWADLGHLYLLAARYRPAVDALRKAIKASNDPVEPWIYDDLAKADLQLGLTAQAKDDLAQARRARTPQEIGDIIEQGYERYQNGDDDSARRDFEAVNEDSFDSLHLAVYHYRHGRLELAADLLEKRLKAIESAPNPSAWDVWNCLHLITWLGRVRHAQGGADERRGEAFLEDGMRLGTRVVIEKTRYFQWHTFILSLLARSEAARGRTEQAEKDFAQARALCDGEPQCQWDEVEEPLLGSAAFYLARGNKDQARRFADQALSRADPSMPFQGNEPDFFVELARILQALGDGAKAEAAYRRIVEARALWEIPKMAQAKKELADIDVKEGKLDEAARLYEDAARIWDKDGPREQAAEARRLSEGLTARLGISRSASSRPAP